MHFNPHTIPHIVCFILATFCGLFVLLRNPRCDLNQIFFILCVTIMAWMSYDFPANFSISPDALTRWYRISYCFISFVPIMIFTFVTRYMNTPRNVFWYRMNALIGFGICLMSLLTDWIVAGINYLPSLPYPQAGKFHILLVLHCFYLVLFSLLPLIKILTTKATNTRLRQHAKYMCCGVLVMAMGTWDFLGNYNFKIYTIGPFCCTIFLILMTTAIAKHQFLNIEIVLKKSFVYTFMVSVMTAIYLLAVLLFDHAFSNYMKLQAITGSLITAILTTIIFVPLRNWLQHLVDRMFFKSTPLAIAEENEHLRQEVVQTEKFKAIAALASGLAHEIKNPLTAIQTFNEHLGRRSNEPGFLEQYQRTVGKETARINNLIQQLLAFAKPSLPQLALVDLSTVIHEVITLIEPKCAEKGIILAQNASGTIMANIDPNQIKQALLNILLNSIDAMPHGGTVTIEVSRSLDRLIIAVSDTGCGISKADLPHIFEPFYSNKEKGTGLGLSITQSIVEQHNGILRVNSQPGLGTTFFIELPYAP